MNQTRFHRKCAPQQHERSIIPATNPRKPEQTSAGTQTEVTAEGHSMGHRPLSLGQHKKRGMSAGGGGLSPVPTTPSSSCTGNQHVCAGTSKDS